MNKNRILLLIVLVLVVAVLVVGFSANSNPDSLTIGAVFPLSGSAASYGTYMKQGVELAIDDAVKAGLIKSDQVHIAMEDGAGDPAKGVAAFHKILTENKPVAVVSALSGTILAIKPIANSEHVVMLNGTAVSVDIEDAPDYLFSVIPNANVEGAFLAQAAFAEGRRSMAIIHRNDASGISFRDAFQKEFTKLGGKIIYTDINEPNATDFRSIIAKVKNIQGVDGVFVASYGPEVAYYLKQSEELDAMRPVYAYTTFNSPKVLEIAGGSAEGVHFSSPLFNALSQSPEAVGLRDKLKAKYNTEDSNYYVASHYDATMLVLNAVHDGSKTSEDIKNYISELDSFDGLSGKIVFDRNGLGTIPLKMYTVSGGKFIEM